MYLHKKDFSITGKTFVEEYTIPSHMAKSSLGDGAYIHPRKISKIDSLQKGKYHLNFIQHMNG